MWNHRIVVHGKYDLSCFRKYKMAKRKAGYLLCLFSPSLVSVFYGLCSDDRNNIRTKHCNSSSEMISFNIPLLNDHVI